MDEFLNKLFGLERHSVITAHDIEHGVLALVAVGVFWYLDNRKGAAGGRGLIGYAVIWIQYFFGIHALISGSTYFLHPDQQMVMDHPLAGPFQHYMDEMGLFGLVKVIETVTGLCLVLNIFVPLVAILEMPVSMIIFYLSVFVAVDSRTIWTGPKEVICNAIILLAYWGYFRPIFFRPFLAWRPIWKEFREPAGETNSTGENHV